MSKRQRKVGSREGTTFLNISTQGPCCPSIHHI